jgi:methyl coenzyme M reductase subunit C-like uncharacterized protein (methanogenesis marker protein 7)
VLLLTKPLTERLLILNKALSDKALKNSQASIEEKITIFNQLRAAMTIACTDNEFGLNDEDEDDDDIENIEQRVKVFRDGEKLQALSAKDSSSIGTIVDEMGTIHDMNIQIATATEEQSAVTSEMNKNVHTITSESSSIHNDSQLIADQSINLANMTARLQTLVNNFKT